jgi:hypothetical protein
MDDYKKMFVLQLAIDTEFFTVHHTLIKIPGVLFLQYIHSYNRSFVTFAEAHLHFATPPLSNDDLSNEPNFGRIHLSGQYI